MKKLIYVFTGLFFLITGQIMAVAPYDYGIVPSVANDSHLDAAYSNWKSRWRKTGPNCSGATLAVNNGNYNEVFSEGQAYGMLMASYLDSDSTDFTKLYRFYKAAFKGGGTNLMSWKVRQLTCNDKIDANIATDADLDAAAALINAHRRWPGEGWDVEATALLNEIHDHLIDPVNEVKPGDTFGGAYDGSNKAINPSYYRLGYFGSYDCFEGGTRWGLVHTRAQNTLNYWYTNYALPPDWAYSDGRYGATTDGNTGGYTYDACRSPWSFVQDWLWFGDTTSRDMTARISDVFYGQDTGSPSNAANQTGDNYNYQSGAKTRNYMNNAVLGGAAVSFMATSRSTYLDAFYNQMRYNDNNSYYSDSLRVIYFMILTGNFQEPCAGGSYTPPPTVETDTPTPDTSFRLIFEDFEYGLREPYTYDDNSATPSPGTSTITVALNNMDSYDGTNSLAVNMTVDSYCGNGFKSSYGVFNATGADAVRLYVKSDKDVSFNFTLKEAAAGVEPEDWITSAPVGVPVLDEWNVITIPLADFIEDQYSTNYAAGNDTFDINVLEGAQLGWTFASDANVLVDRIEFVYTTSPLTPTPTKTPFTGSMNLIYDDMEDALSLDQSGTPAYAGDFADTANGASSSIIKIDNGVYADLYSAQINYNTGSLSAWGCGVYLLSPYAGSQFYVDADGAVSIGMWISAPEGMKYQIQITETGEPTSITADAEGEAWLSPYLTVQQTGWHWVEVDLPLFTEDPYNEICHPVPGCLLSGDGVLDAQGIASVGIKLIGGQGSGTFFIDNVAFVTEYRSPTPSPTITDMMSPTDSPTVTESYTASPDYSSTDTPTITMTATPGGMVFNGVWYDGETTGSTIPPVYLVDMAGNTTTAPVDMVGVVEMTDGGYSGTNYIRTTGTTQVGSWFMGMQAGRSPSIDLSAFNQLTIAFRVPAQTNCLSMGVQLISDGIEPNEQSVKVPLQLYLDDPGIEVNNGQWRTATVPLDAFLGTNDVSPTAGTFDAAELTRIKGVSVMPLSRSFEDGAITDVQYDVDSIRFISGAWVPDTVEAGPVFSDFEDMSGASNWGTYWFTFYDAGICSVLNPAQIDTSVSFPAPAAGKPIDADGDTITPCFAGRMAGILGGGGGTCTDGGTPPVTKYSHAGFGAAFADPMPVAGVNIADKIGRDIADITGLRLYMRANAGHDVTQEIKIVLESTTATCGGCEYYHSVPAATLAGGDWTLIEIPFPAEGAASGSPTTSFGQPSWLGATSTDRYAWSLTNLKQIKFQANTNNQSFDISVDNVEFMTVPLVTPTATPTSTITEIVPTDTQTTEPSLTDTPLGVSTDTFTESPTPDGNTPTPTPTENLNPFSGVWYDGETTGSTIPPVYLVDLAGNTTTAPVDMVGVVEMTDGGYSGTNYIRTTGTTQVGSWFMGVQAGRSPAEDVSVYNVLKLAYRVPSQTNCLSMGVQLISSGTEPNEQSMKVPLQLYLDEPGIEVNSGQWRTVTIPLSAFLGTNDVSPTAGIFDAVELSRIKGITVMPLSRSFEDGAITDVQYDVDSIRFETVATPPIVYEAGPVFSDFEDMSGASNWGTYWFTFYDAGICSVLNPAQIDTSVSFPAPAAGKPIDADGDTITPCFAGRMAGILGGGGGTCTDGGTPPVTKYSHAGFGAAFADPMPVAGVNIADKIGRDIADITGLRLYMRANAGHDVTQEIKIVLESTTATCGGCEYYHSVPAATLAGGDWTLIEIPFPAEGAASGSPTTSFGQPSWLGATSTDRYAWSLTNLKQIKFQANTNNQGFDISVDNVEFMTVPLVTPTATPTATLTISADTPTFTETASVDTPTLTETSVMNTPTETYTEILPSATFTSTITNTPDITLTFTPTINESLTPTHTVTENRSGFPIVFALNKVTGLTTGGETVVISGLNFVSGVQVVFGTAVVTSITFIDSQTLEIVTPANLAGVVDVSVINPDTTSGVMADAFTYQEPTATVTVTSVITSTFTSTLTFTPQPTATQTALAPDIQSVNITSGPDSGGTQLEIYGLNFQLGTTVLIGGTVATNVTVSVNGELIRATTAAHAAALVDIQIINPDGQMDILYAAYRYMPAPTQTSTVTPVMDSGVDIIEQYPVPNPNPQVLIAYVTGRVEKVKVRVYSSGRILVDSFEQENPSANILSLPAKLGNVAKPSYQAITIVLGDFLQNAASGVYHYVIETEGDGQFDRVVGSFVILK